MLCPAGNHHLKYVAFLKARLPGIMTLHFFFFFLLQKMSGLICVEQVYPCKFRSVEYVPVLKPRQNQQLLIFEGIITISDAED